MSRDDEVRPPPAAGETREPRVVLPAPLLLALAVAVPAVFAASWYALAAVRSGPDAARAGAAGAGVVALVNVAGILVLGPRRKRAVGTWMNLWLAATVLRMLATPLLTILLYSATSLPAEPLGLAVGLSYVLTLMTEAAVLAASLHRQTGAP